MEQENKDNDVLFSKDITSDGPAPQETAPPAPQVQAESFAVQSDMGEKPEGGKAQLFNEEGSSSAGENSELTKALPSDEGRQSLIDGLEKAERVLDEALKASDVELAAWFSPPSETNFAGGLLTGTQSACKAACEAFAQAVQDVAARPREE